MVTQTLGLVSNWFLSQLGVWVKLPRKKKLINWLKESKGAWFTSSNAPTWVIKINTSWFVTPWDGRTRYSLRYKKKNIGPFRLELQKTEQQGKWEGKHSTRGKWKKRLHNIYVWYQYMSFSPFLFFFNCFRRSNNLPLPLASSQLFPLPVSVHVKTNCDPTQNY